MSNSHESPSTPKNKRVTGGDKASKMHVDALHVVVRLLPSNGLEGAFRVHVLPESLDAAHLKVGDLCEIAAEDGSTGYGIAWRADDRMGNRPKNRPAKMTETIRTAFGFDEGSQVTISKTDAKLFHADKIILSDVTPREYNKSESIDDDCWKSHITSLFVKCDAIAMGISFDVTGKKKVRRRFYIESVESRDAPSDSPCLYSFSDNTQLVCPDGFVTNGASNGHADGQPTRTGDGLAATTVMPQHRLNTDHIGGLLEQCQQLNRQLRRLLNKSKALNEYAQKPNPPVLLHGYEGTGKTFLLDALAGAGFSKVLRLDRATLTGGSIAKNQAIIHDTFREATDTQPSLVLMDDIDNLVPSDDVAYAKKLVSEIEMVAGKKVMVVAATRNPSSVHTALFGHRCFTKRLELPVPDQAAREQILNILSGKPVYASDTLSTQIAARTHGFTANDVACLHSCAQNHAADRYDQECEELAMGRAPTPPSYTEATEQVDENMAGKAKDGDKPTMELVAQDFEYAFQQVKPTALREIFTEKPRTKWADIGGSVVVKNSFDKIIGWQLHHKDLIVQLGYKPPKGVLLYGPPGCSKTLTAQAVANTYNFNFIAIKGAELISMYVGESERAIRDVFRKARAAAPCVIFFDEIDSIGSDRDGGGTKGLNVLTTLLNEMDGFEPLKDVFILAATNKPETLDPALMRPGRFDKHVYLGPPSDEARKEILHIATTGVPIAGDVDFDQLVTDTEGYSGAELVRICEVAKEAVLERAMVNKGAEIKIFKPDFEMACKEVKRNITPEMLAAYEIFSRGNER